MKIQDLKKLVLLSKKESKELSQAYAAIMKKVESVTIGSKTVIDDESKLILKSAQKELKELLEAKSSGAPFNPVGIDVCEKVISELQPKMLTEEEINVSIAEFLAVKSDAKMGEIMGYLKKTHGDTVDMSVASKLLKGK